MKLKSTAIFGGFILLLSGCTSTEVNNVALYICMVHLKKESVRYYAIFVKIQESEGHFNVLRKPNNASF